MVIEIEKVLMPADRKAQPPLRGDARKVALRRSTMAKLIVEKNRTGRPGILDVHFSPAWQTFFEQKRWDWLVSQGIAIPPGTKQDVAR